MSRHIALLAPQVGRDGGVAAHVLDSAAALGAAGHAVTLMCARSEYALEGVESVTYVDAGDAAAVEATLRSCAPDVVHLHDYADPDVVGVVRRVAPAVLSAHAYPGCTPNTHYFAAGVECDRPHGPGCVVNMALRGCLHARDPRPVPRRYRQASRRMAAYAQADAVVCYSTAIARHLRRNGFDAQRVPLFTTLESTEHATTRVGEPAGGSQVLFVGRVVAEKGLHVLLQALAPVDASLTVVGDGLALPAARQQAADLGMSARVQFAGWLSGAELAAAYGRAAVVAVPSVWPEPFGLVGLEAMAASKPVVGSLTGGIVDWLQPKVTGLGVRPGSAEDLRAALVTVLGDPALGRAMGAAGRASLDASFTARAHVAALEAVYGDAARRWSSRRADD